MSSIELDHDRSNKQTEHNRLEYQRNKKVDLDHDHSNKQIERNQLEYQRNKNVDRVRASCTKEWSRTCPCVNHDIINYTPMEIPSHWQDKWHKNSHQNIRKNCLLYKIPLLRNQNQQAPLISIGFLTIKIRPQKLHNSTISLKGNKAHQVTQQQKLNKIHNKKWTVLWTSKRIITG